MKSVTETVPPPPKAKPGASSNYHKLFGAYSLTFLGDGLTLTAVPWLVSSLTSNPLHASWVTLALRLPWLLFSLPAGILIDRMSRKGLIAAASLLRTLLLLVLTVCIAAGWISIPLLAVFMFGIGLSRVLFDSTVQTLLPSVVERSRLEQANGRFTAGQLISSDMVGVGLGGLVITLSLIIPFAVDTVTAFAASALLLLLRGSFRPDTSQRDITSPIQKAAIATWRQDMLFGFRYIYADPFLRPLALLSIFITLMASSLVATQVYFAQEVLGLDSFGFAILILVATLGSLLASQVISKMRTRWNPRQLLLVSILAMMMVYGACGVFVSPYAVGLFYFTAAFFITVYNITRTSLLQRSVPDAYLGRVGSVFRFLSMGVSAIGAVVGGLIVTSSEQMFSRTFALQLPYLLLAAVYAVCLLAGSRLLKENSDDH
ncbi:MFS transporter [Paenibacillus sp. JX-17]|uniref:MFS transporter n=1 Tax=Paenibacillus lacisoli TaxID=3064525 RepID=A0ABT9CHT7_9BACL|nr:MFS transporter [Paenibacillus sp. JX-17]MDO7908834.1 MFS transporter [Paenibacillus sp. JX-17]